MYPVYKKIHNTKNKQHKMVVTLNIASKIFYYDVKCMNASTVLSLCIMYVNMERDDTQIEKCPK